MPGNRLDDIGQETNITLTHALVEAIVMLPPMLEEQPGDRVDTLISLGRIQIRHFLDYRGILVSGGLFRSLGCFGLSSA